jgi:hypothetical protein
MKSLLKDVKILKINNDAAAGVTVITSDIIDMQGFNGVCFVCKMGAVVDAASVTMTVYQGAVSTLLDEAALVASAAIPVASTDSEQSLVVDIVKPRERYLRVKVARITQNSAIDSIFALLYNPMAKPVVQPATIDASTQTVSPAEA